MFFFVLVVVVHAMRTLLRIHIRFAITAAAGKLVRSLYVCMSSSIIIVHILHQHNKAPARTRATCAHK